MHSRSAFSILILLAFAALAGPALADPAGVKCVQNELNALGYKAGSADGVIGNKTQSAVSAYVHYMESQTAAGWTMPALTADNANHTCQMIADAFPEVSKFWLAIDVINGLDVAVVTFKSVPGNPFGNYEGTYQYLRNGGWLEVNSSARFSFVEKSRTTSRITLWDGSRNLTVIIWAQMGGDIAFVYNGGPVTTFAKVTALARGTPE